MLDPSSSTGPIRVDGFHEDVAFAKSEYLTRAEVLNRRVHRLKQLARIYRDHYWTLMEELKGRYREYYWDYGKNPYSEGEGDGFDEVLSYACTRGLQQPLYKALQCLWQGGPILCNKPTVPSYCRLHFQKAEKHMVHALKKAGLNNMSPSKLAPKFHLIVTEYVRQIQRMRKDAQKVNLDHAEIEEKSLLPTGLDTS